MRTRLKCFRVATWSFGISSANVENAFVLHNMIDKFECCECIVETFFTCLSWILKLLEAYSLSGKVANVQYITTSFHARINTEDLHRHTKQKWRTPWQQRLSRMPV